MIQSSIRWICLRVNAEMSAPLGMKRRKMRFAFSFDPRSEARKGCAKKTSQRPPAHSVLAINRKGRDNRGHLKGLKR